MISRRSLGELLRLQRISANCCTSLQRVRQARDETIPKISTCPAKVSRVDLVAAGKRWNDGTYMANVCLSEAWQDGEREVLVW